MITGTQERAGDDATAPPPAPMTALDICNIALSKLGESPIVAIDPNGSPAARMCYMHYHPVRREVLCATRWTFACVLITLQSPEDTGLAEPPAAVSGGSVPHTLPPDCLRVLEVNHPRWTLRGRCIYCPSRTLRLLYIADVEDPALFDPLFTEAFATRLAAKMCIPLTSSTTAREALTEEYTRLALPQAAHMNAVQCYSNDTHPLYRLWRNSLSRGDCE